MATTSKTVGPIMQVIPDATDTDLELGNRLWKSIKAAGTTGDKLAFIIHKTVAGVVTEIPFYLYITVDQTGTLVCPESDDSFNIRFDRGLSTIADPALINLLLTFATNKWRK